MLFYIGSEFRYSENMVLSGVTDMVCDYTSILSEICSGCTVTISKGPVKWKFQISSVQVQNQIGRTAPYKVQVMPLYIPYMSISKRMLYLTSSSINILTY